MSKILCFGELLMRLSPQLNGEWIRQHYMPVFIGGAELNTATALARWRVPVSYFTVLPDHYLSNEIIDAIQQKGIDISRVKFSGNRIGTYYLPQGADLKNAGVIYDRAHSSFWELQPGQLDWDEILKDVSWLNFSAINPALNANVAVVCIEALKAASQKGITVSVDLNYRSKLWQYAKEPNEIMPDLVQYCDVVMGNVWAADKMLGIKISQGLGTHTAAYLEQSQRTSEEIMKKFPKCKQVAHTFRIEKEEGLDYYATLFQNERLYVSPEFHTNSVIDRIGSGDTFMAGLIYGIFHQHSAEEIINFAAAAAFNKLFIKGDATTASVEEIKKVVVNYA